MSVHINDLSFDLLKYVLNFLDDKQHELKFIEYNKLFCFIKYVHNLNMELILCDEQNYFIN